MKSSFFLFAALAGTMVVAGPSPQSQIAEIYKKMQGSALKKDVAGMMSFTTSDFQHIEKDGRKMNRKQVETQLKSSFAMLKALTKVTYTVKSAKVAGSTAEAVVQRRLEGKILNPQTKKDVAIVQTSESKETLVKDKTGWKVKKVVMVKRDMMIDGKPMVAPTTTRQ